MVLSNDMSLEFLPHYPLCFSVKLLLVSLIVAKLVLHRKRLQESFEDSSGELTRPYTFLIHIFIQSHALYGALSLIFLGLYLTAQPAWRTILPNIVQAGVCHPSAPNRLKMLTCAIIFSSCHTSLSVSE